MKSVRGFSLIELMIVVAVIGILAAIAFPSYTGYVLRSNRTVGKTSMMKILGQQESFFSDRKSYALALDTLASEYPAAIVFVARDGKAAAANSAAAIYRITLENPTATSFTVMATPVNTQARDAKCAILRVGSDGSKAASGPDGAECWK